MQVACFNTQENVFSTSVSSFKPLLNIASVFLEEHLPASGFRGSEDTVCAAENVTSAVL